MIWAAILIGLAITIFAAYGWTVIEPDIFEDKSFLFGSFIVIWIIMTVATYFLIVPWLVG